MQLLRFNRRQRIVFDAGAILFVAILLYPPWLEIHSYPVERHVEVTLPPLFAGEPDRKAWTGTTEDISYSKSAGYSWIRSPPAAHTKPPVTGQLTYGPVTQFTSGYPLKVTYAVDWLRLGWQWTALIVLVGVAVICLRDRAQRVKDATTSSKMLPGR
jgi:hypothetical protein